MIISIVIHYEYYHYFHQVILIMEYLDGGNDDYNYDSSLVLSLFLSGDPDNGVFGRRRAFRESCRGGFQPHRVRLLPIHEADLQVPSQSLFSKLFFLFMLFSLFSWEVLKTDILRSAPLALTVSKCENFDQLKRA